MRAIRPRREFLKRQLALSFLGAPAAAVVARDAITEYDIRVFPVAGFAYQEGPSVLGRLRAAQRQRTT